MGWVLLGVLAQGLVERTSRGTATAAAAWDAEPRIREALAGRLDEAAHAIAGGCRQLPPPDQPDRPNAPAADPALPHAYGLLLATVGAPPRSRAGQRRARFARQWGRAFTGVASRGCTARVALCMGAAELARQAVPVAHGYWVLIRVAICLKPDFQPVLARTLQRIAGTVLGALPAVLLVRTTSPTGQLLALGLLACGIPYAVRRNHGLFAVLITPIALIVLHFGGPVGSAGVAEHIVTTLLGAGVLLAFGYALWPGTWGPPSRAPRRAPAHRVGPSPRRRGQSCRGRRRGHGDACAGRCTPNSPI